MACEECNKRAAESHSTSLDAAKTKARAWGRATGKTELIIVKDAAGQFGYRTTDADRSGITEVDRVLILS